MTQFGWTLNTFEDCSILAEKQQLKPRISSSLMDFASLDAQLDPQVTRLVEWNKSGVKKPSVFNRDNIHHHSLQCCKATKGLTLSSEKTTVFPVATLAYTENVINARPATLSLLDFNHGFLVVL